MVNNMRKKRNKKVENGKKRKKVKKVSLHSQATPKDHANLKIMHRKVEKERGCMTDLKTNYKKGGERGREEGRTR